MWSEARRELPFVFGVERVRERRRGGRDLHARRVDAGRRAAPPCSASALELGVVHAMERRLGFVGEVYRAGRGRPVREGLDGACVAAGAGLLALGGRRSRAAAVAGGALVLAGELALRWSIFRAGFQSARDPKYTVVPQKARKAARTAEPGSRSEPGVVSLSRRRAGRRRRRAARAA